MSKNILIIDDARDIAQAFKKQLDLTGSYEVDTASGGSEGLEKIAAGNFDLVLLDLVMPDIDGIEVLTTIKSDPKKYKDVPVIVSTNVTAEDTRKEIEALGAAGFVVKTDVDIDSVVDGFFAKA